jgi:5-methylcytosine-specific restriction endonuclease McrA
MVSSSALLLNASFEPLLVVSWERAIQLLFSGKVEVVEEWDREIRTVRLSVKAPSVVRLVRYIPLQKNQDIVRFSRLNVLLRDRFRCQYCAEIFPRTSLTMDHIVPVVQGGQKSWTNIVTSCRLCNQKKGGRTPAQAKMKLIRPPTRPKWLPEGKLDYSLAQVPENWKIYLRINGEKEKAD